MKRASAANSWAQAAKATSPHSTAVVALASPQVGVTTNSLAQALGHLHQGKRAEAGRKSQSILHHKALGHLHQGKRAEAGRKRQSILHHKANTGVGVGRSSSGLTELRFFQKKPPPPGQKTCNNMRTFEKCHTAGCFAMAAEHLISGTGNQCWCVDVRYPQLCPCPDLKTEEFECLAFETIAAATEQPDVWKELQQAGHKFNKYVRVEKKGWQNIAAYHKNPDSAPDSDANGLSSKIGGNPLLKVDAGADQATCQAIQDDEKQTLKDCYKKDCLAVGTSCEESCYCVKALHPIQCTEETCPEDCMTCPEDCMEQTVFQCIAYETSKEKYPIEWKYVEWMRSKVDKFMNKMHFGFMMISTEEWDTLEY